MPHMKYSRRWQPPLCFTAQAAHGSLNRPFIVCVTFHSTRTLPRCIHSYLSLLELVFRSRLFTCIYIYIYSREGKTKDSQLHSLSLGRESLLNDVRPGWLLSRWWKMMQSGHVHRLLLLKLLQLSCHDRRSFRQHIWSRWLTPENGDK